MAHAAGVSSRGGSASGARGEGGGTAGAKAENAADPGFDDVAAVDAFLERCGVVESNSEYSWLMREDKGSCLKQALLSGHVAVPLELRFADDASAFLGQVVRVPKFHGSNLRSR